MDSRLSNAELAELSAIAARGRTRADGKKNDERLGRRFLSTNQSLERLDKTMDSIAEIRAAMNNLTPGSLASPPMGRQDMRHGTMIDPAVLAASRAHHEEQHQRWKNSYVTSRRWEHEDHGDWTSSPTISAYTSPQKPPSHSSRFSF